MTAVRDDLATLEAGLDALETPNQELRRTTARALSATWPPVLALLLVLAGWQAAYACGLRDPAQLPSPLAVWTVLTRAAMSGDLVPAVGGSLRRGALGFLASVAIGTPLGLLLARNQLLGRMFGPLVTGLQSLPSVVWVPGAVVWFGVSDTAVYAVVLLGAVPSIANGLVSGLAQVPPLYERLGRVLGTRGLASARFLLLPAALPGYLAGLRQGWAFAWRSLMAAELIGSTSAPALGQLLQRGRQLSDMPLVLSGIATVLVVGMAVELCVFAPVERSVLRRRGLGQK